MLCITGVADAADLIKNGQEIVVDGYLGVVTINKGGQIGSRISIKSNKAVLKIISAHSKIRLLLLLDYPQKFKSKAAWDDSVFWVKHVKHIERLAIVG